MTKRARARREGVSLGRLIGGGATQVHGRANGWRALIQKDPLRDIRIGGAIGAALVPVGGTLMSTGHLRMLGEGGMLGNRGSGRSGETGAVNYSMVMESCATP